MRRKEFEVPTDCIEEFSAILGEHELNNSILGTTEDGDIHVMVEYDKEDRNTVFILDEMIFDYNEEKDEEDEDEEEEDD